jgi:steroid delta-isomerase-like uncharacterized protein
MTNETHKAIESMNEAWNTHDVEKIAEHFAEEATFQDPLTPAAVKGKAQLKAHLTGLFTAFPDFHVKLGEVIVSGDSAVSINTATGTNTGPMVAPGGKHIPATNRKLTHEAAIHIQTDGKGKVVKARVYGDSLTIFQQLGLAPQ